MKNNYLIVNIVKYTVGFIIIFLPLYAQAKITLKCDVVYESSMFKWSDYYRRDVDFMSGHEIGGIYRGSDLYAVIWFSQTNCAIIKMDYNGLLLSEVDEYFMSTYFGFDVLNEGRLGEQVNADEKIRWRIYGKDERGFMIDDAFKRYPFDEHNKNVAENIKKGIYSNRQRPVEEQKYAGLNRGVVVWCYENCYIIQAESTFMVALRNEMFYFSGNVNKGDVVFGNFHSGGYTDVSNATQDYTGLKVDIVYTSSDYKSCADWVIKNVKFESY